MIPASAYKLKCEGEYIRIGVLKKKLIQLVKIVIFDKMYFKSFKECLILYEYENSTLCEDLKIVIPLKYICYWILPW